MTKYVAILLVAMAATAGPAIAQRDAHANNRPRANAGHLPAAPARRTPQAPPEQEHSREGHVNSMPHVSNDHWYGHATPTDRRYHVDHPFPAGHFAHLGPRYRYNVVRIDPRVHRLWIPGGYYFDVAPWEWPLAETWCWDCGDDFVLYLDADHSGWYLLYNVHTGAFIHVRYAGV